MKKSELRSLIREEIEKVINEATSLPSSYDAKNPGKEWIDIFTKQLERYKKYPDNKKVLKDIQNLLTVVYKLAAKNANIMLSDTPAEYARVATYHPAKQRGGPLPIEQTAKDLIAWIKKDVDPNDSPNWSHPNTDKMVKSKKWSRITPQTELKVNNEIVQMGNMIFRLIVKIEGDTYYVQSDMDYAGEKPTKLSRKQLEQFYLVKIK